MLHYNTHQITSKIESAVSIGHQRLTTVAHRPWHIALQWEDMASALSPDLTVCLVLSSVPWRRAVLGDLNHDGSVDITDVVLLVNHILGNTSDTSFSTQDADINKDGDIDINDVVKLVNFILGQ